MAAPVATPARRHQAVAGLGFLLLALASVAAWAQPQLPPPAYQLAAQHAGVPSLVLYAIALQESGRRWQGRSVPWPWTLNVAGEAKRFANRHTACSGLVKAMDSTPDRKIDVGLGQINLGYHRHRVTHPCDLVDPYQNLAIAAAILVEQRAAAPDWPAAIGRYHRPAGGALAARYQRLVQAHLDRLQGQVASGLQVGELP
ncbi:transglycosylase SLT domain-containing protein [Pseudomonas sp. 102515]|uniref:transglycosylase SLT domain-containing protein n=1 Tax=Pseudomonas sp. 102515 TaxID=3071568 RepID=UPI002800E55B|nr:transglycosylase SLT domain-containing protein [Pseudomonas sp. 102515]MDQ7914244.1 transglycosylase SLT domain-containing protein [Pseudomonas sp. 102515]